MHDLHDEDIFDGSWAGFEVPGSGFVPVSGFDLGLVDLGNSWLALATGHNRMIGSMLIGTSSTYDEYTVTLKRCRDAWYYIISCDHVTKITRLNGVVENPCAEIFFNHG